MGQHTRVFVAAVIAITLVSPVAIPTRSNDVGAVHAQEPPVRYRDIVFDRLERTNDIVYGTATDIPSGRTVELKLDLYEPAGDTERARPVFVFVHGGGFVSGDKSAGQRWAAQFARRGWVAASIGYRLSQGNLATVGIPAAVSDARQSLRWLWNASPQYRLDMGRMVVGGSSAGAITSLFLTYTEMEKDADDAFVSVAGVMDLWGGLYGQESEMTAGEPPLVIVHGTEDQVVPFRLAEALRDRADEVGIPYDYHALPGVGHGWGDTDQVATWSAEFFYPLLWPDINLPTDTPDTPATRRPSTTPTSTGVATGPSPTPTSETSTPPNPTSTAAPQPFRAYLPLADRGAPDQ